MCAQQLVLLTETLVRRGNYRAEDLDTKVQILRDVVDGQGSNRGCKEVRHEEEYTIDLCQKQRCHLVCTREGKHGAFKEATSDISSFQCQECHDVIDGARAKLEPTVERPHHCCKNVRFCQPNEHWGPVSEGWLTHFKARRGFTFRSVCGERADVNNDTCEWWLSRELHKLLAL